VAARDGPHGGRAPGPRADGSRKASPAAHVHPAVPVTAGEGSRARRASSLFVALRLKPAVDCRIDAASPDSTGPSRLYRPGESNEEGAMRWIFHYWKLEIAAGLGYAIFLSCLVGFLKR